MAQLTTDEVMALHPAITLADVRRMKTWPHLPPTRTIAHDGVYVARSTSTPVLFWQGGTHWVHIHYPDRGFPKVWTAALPLLVNVPFTYWVRVGTVIPLLDEEKP